MVTKKTWKEFRSTGLLLIINQLLHIFGWSIIYELDDAGTIIEVYPARVKFRGFSEDITSKAYTEVSEYLKDNIDELLEESKDLG